MPRSGRGLSARTMLITSSLCTCMCLCVCVCKTCFVIPNNNRFGFQSLSKAIAAVKFFLYSDSVRFNSKSTKQYAFSVEFNSITSIRSTCHIQFNYIRVQFDHMNPLKQVTFNVMFNSIAFEFNSITSTRSSKLLAMPYSHCHIDIN